MQVLDQHGYDGTGHAARQFAASWFAARDLVVALDSGHLDDLRALAGDTEHAARVVLLRAYDPRAVAAGALDVDDPYYGGVAGFTGCLANIERACRGLLEHVRSGLEM